VFVFAALDILELAQTDRYRFGTVADIDGIGGIGAGLAGTDDQG
jgi:hypothetical protein